MNDEEREACNRCADISKHSLLQATDQTHKAVTKIARLVQAIGEHHAEKLENAIHQHCRGCRTQAPFDDPVDPQLWGSPDGIVCKEGCVEKCRIEDCPLHPYRSAATE